MLMTNNSSRVFIINALGKFYVSIQLQIKEGVLQRGRATKAITGPNLK